VKAIVQTVLIRLSHTRTTGSMLIVYAPHPSMPNFMPTNHVPLYLVDVCDNRISTVQTSQFKQDLKSIKYAERYDIDYLLAIVELLARNQPLAEKLEFKS